MLRRLNTPQHQRRGTRTDAAGEIARRRGVSRLPSDHDPLRAEHHCPSRRHNVVLQIDDHQAVRLKAFRRRVVEAHVDDPRGGGHFVRDGALPTKTVGARRSARCVRRLLRAADHDADALH